MLHGYGPALLGGLWTTLSVAALSLAVACVFGLAGAAAKLSGSATLRASSEQLSSHFDRHASVSGLKTHPFLMRSSRLLTTGCLALTLNPMSSPVSHRRILDRGNARPISSK